MKKRLAIITTTALLGLTLNSSLVFADTTNTTNSAQSNATVTNTINPSQSASTSNESTVAPTSSSTSTGTNTATSAVTTDNSTESTSGTAAGTTASSLQLPPVQNSNGQTVTAGTLPDSPLYWLTNLIQKIELALTFNPAQKASVVQQQALQNLAAAEAMQQNGKTDLAQKSLTEYSDKISQAESFLNQINNPNSDTAKALVTGLAQTSAANIAVLSGLLDKLPPQAAKKVALNIVRSLEKDVNQAKSNQGQPNKAKDKEQTALSKLTKMYGITNTASTDTNSDNNTTDSDTSSNDKSTAATQTTASANQAVSESTSSNTPSSVGEQNKSPIARAREKGQQGTAMSGEHSASKAAQPPHHS